MRQFGEFWGGGSLVQLMLSGSCAAARVHDFRSVFHLIASESVSEKKAPVFAG